MKGAVVLRGNLVALRARWDADVAVLQAGLHDDVSTRCRADSRPWKPLSPGSTSSPYAVTDPADDVALFSVVTLPAEMEGDDGELIGEALLWGIDTHNRAAHLGISLLAPYRHRGFGTDVVQVLCHYGFQICGLRRLQIETLRDNTAMIAAANRAGFILEGTLRDSAWVEGRFVDEVLLGLLAGADRPTS